MQIILSPAKSLELSKKYPDFVALSTPMFLNKAAVIQGVLKKKKAKALMELQDISLNLAQINEQRNQDWSIEGHQNKGRPALFTFDGDVYEGLDAYSLSLEDYNYAIEHLFILSGLYGILRPSDTLLPYRLEMGTALTVQKEKNLYQFWRSELQDYMHEHYRGQYLANLASVEYSKALDLKKLEMRVINFEFLNQSNGKLKNISFFAKKARGMMARFIIENKIENPDHLSAFDTEGYTFAKDLSHLYKFVFIR